MYQSEFFGCKQILALDNSRRELLKDNLIIQKIHEKLDVSRSRNKNQDTRIPWLELKLAVVSSEYSHAIYTTAREYIKNLNE